MSRMLPEWANKKTPRGEVVPNMYTTFDKALVTKLLVVLWPPKLRDGGGRRKLFLTYSN